MKLFTVNLYIPWSLFSDVETSWGYKKCSVRV